MIKRPLILALSIVLAANIGCDGGDHELDEDRSAELRQQPDGEDVDETDELDDESTTKESVSAPSLRTHGTLRDVNMHDDYSPSVELNEALNSDESLDHAVGALGELAGEITVVDDTVYLAEAGDEPTFRTVDVGDVDGLEATILFGVQTAGWTTLDTPPATLSKLEKHLEDWRTAHDVDTPLAFVVDDPAAEVEWHVVDADELPEDGADSCEERKRHAHQFETRGEPIRIAGLFTPDQTGVVVDHTTSIHAHVVTDDERSGHVDELKLSDEARLEVAVR